MTDPLLLTTPVEVDPLVGSQIGEYRVIQRIGRGGMGVVYAGEQPVIGKKVALKVLLPEIAHDEDATRRFLQEARSANQIGHRNIIDIFSFGQLPNGQQYLVMEYLEGQPLDDLIRERAPLSAIETVHLLDDVASGLAAAHAAGILHRDLKPSNLFIVDQSDGSSFVKILDFGLAKVTKRKEERSPTTHYGTVLGTPEYMAPEQARGEDLDQRVDIYAFGVIAFEMLTGRLPFQGKSELETISKHLTEPVPSPSDYQPVIPALEALVMRLLDKDREKRPASLGLVRAEFKRVKRALEAESTQMVYQVRPAKPPSLGPPVPSESFAPTRIAVQTDPTTGSIRARRKSRVWIAGAVVAIVVVAVAVGGVIALWGTRGAAAPVETAAVAPQPPPPPNAVDPTRASALPVAAPALPASSKTPGVSPASQDVPEKITGAPMAGRQVSAKSAEPEPRAVSTARPDESKQAPVVKKKKKSTRPSDTPSVNDLEPPHDD